MAIAKRPKENPFVDDSDPKPSSEDAVQRVKERISEREEAAEPKEIAVDPPDRDDEPEERGSRQQRRSERGELLRAKEVAESRAREAEARAAALQVERESWSRQQHTQQRPDPLEEAEKALAKELGDHVKLSDSFKGPIPQEQVDAWREKYFTLQKRGQDLAAQKAIRASGAGQRAPDVQLEVTKATLQAKYADVIAAGDHALQYADGILRTNMAKSRRPISQVNMADYEAAMEQTRRDLRLSGGQSPTPSADLKRKFSGVPTGGASSNGESRTIKMTKAEEGMAEEMYKREKDPKTGKMRNLTPSESHQKWAQRVGKKRFEREAS